jgi:hypothetical protein
MHSRTYSRRGDRQRGVVAVEFALVVVIFLAFVFGVLELARAMYVINTLEEVTRRAATAASNTNFKDANAISNVRIASVFRTSPGLLPLADPVTDSSIRIDYLSVSRGSDGSLTMNPIAEGSLPSCPARNRLVCLANPNDPSCIQLVRARVCASVDASGACEPVQYQMLFPFVNFPLQLPTAVAIVPAGSLGYRVGNFPCP